MIVQYMSTILSEGSRCFGYQVTRMMSMPSALVTASHPTFCTLDPMTRRSRSGIGEVWAMVAKLAFSLVIQKA